MLRNTNQTVNGTSCCSIFATANFGISPNPRKSDSQFLSGVKYSIDLKSFGSNKGIEKSVLTNEGDERMQIDKINFQDYIRWHCPVCDHPFKSEQGVKQHYQAKHMRTTSNTQEKTQLLPKKNNFQCNECKKIFKTAHALHQHQEMKHQFKYVCDKCFQRFKSPQSLRQHKKDSHHIIMCPCCKEFEGHTTDLQIHLETIHKNYLCIVCHDVFDSRENLSTHQKTAHSIYHCDECNYRFLNQQDFSKHLEKFHGENTENRLKPEKIANLTAEQKKVLFCNHQFQWFNMNNDLAIEKCIHCRKTREEIEIGKRSTFH